MAGAERVVAVRGEDAAQIGLVRRADGEAGDGDFLVFLQRPFSAIVLGLAAVMIVLPLVGRRFGRARDAVGDTRREVSGSPAA